MKILTACFCITSGSAMADVIELRTDPWCPYVCQDPEMPGYMVEVAREALAPFGHEINVEHISWSRAIQQAEQGQIDGIVGGIPEEAPDLVWSGPLFPFEDALIFRAGEGRNVSNSEDLNGVRIGVINDYDYYGAVNDYIVANADDRSLVQYAAGFEPLTTNLRKLIAGRIDVVAETEAVVSHRVSALDILGQVEVVTLGGGSFVEIGFAPSNNKSKVYVRELREGFQALEASGRVAEIMAKYGQ